MDGSVDPTDLFRSPTRSFGARTDEQLPPLAVELVVDEDDEENTLYTYSHTTQYFTRTQILKLMLAWIRNHQHDRRNAHTDAALDDEIPTPTYHPDKPGSYWGIFKTKKKFADDCYAPWCLTQDGKQRRPRSNNAPLTFEECEVFVREKRIEHPKQSDFHKQTMSISHMPEAENVVFIMYSFCVEDMILPPVAKPKPSQEMRNIVVQACEGRTFQKALEFIPDHVRQKLQMKQIRNIAKRVESYVKTKCGAAPTTDPLELITLSSSISGFQGTVTDVYIDPKKQKAGQPKTRKVAEITYLCEDAFRAFLKGCATLDKIKAHHKECKRIETMRSLQEQTSECNNLLTSLTESQLIRGVAGVVQIDTTFGLSGLFVTLIVGVLTQFVTNQSRKNRPIILGFLMHSDRKVHHHTNMARRIDDMISHIDSTKFISAYITDGEASLKEMCTGPAFSHAVHLRCDVHRRKNMLFKIERLLPPEDVKEFEVKMFGTKWKNSLGEIVHIGGAFAKMDMKRFKQELSQMKEYFNHPQISSLLDRKAESYYYANSMMAKLRGGVLCQWVTTNIIEGMNHLVQRRIPRREAGHVTAQKLVQFIKDSVTELWKAAITDSSEVLVAPTSTHGASTYLNWFKMKRPGKMEVINFFGLPEKMTGKDSNLPQWVHENYDNIENYLGKYTVEILMDGNSFLMYKTGDKLSSITLMIRNDYVVCGDRNCKDVYRHTKITPCRHIIAVLSSMHSNISHTFWKKYELNFEQLSPQQRLALTQSGGDGTKRIGNPRSKHNDIRTTDFVSHSVYNNPAVESHTVDDSLDDIQSSPILPKRRIQQKPPAAIQNLSTTSLFDDSDLHKGAIERLGLTRALDEGSTLAVKKKTPAPTRAVTSTTKPKKQTLVESHTVDDSLDDIQSSPILPKRRIQQKPPAAIQNLSTTSLFDDSDLHKGAIERLGLTRALDEGSTLTVKKKTPAPTRAVTSTTKPKKQTLGVSHAVAPTRAATTRTTKPSGLVKTKEKAARLTIDGFSRNVKRKPKLLGWSDDDMGESDLILQHDSPTQHSPTPYYDHNYSRETESHIVEEENTVEEPFAYGNIGEAMFPEFIDNDFASAEARLEQVEIARRQYANVEKERKRSPTPLLINEKPNYETLDAKPAKLPRLEAPLINSTRPSCEPRDPLLLNETPNYEQLDVKPARLTRLEAARLNSTRPCYEEVKPQTLPRRVLSPRDVRNFYSKKKDKEGLVKLPHKATPARRSLRLAGSSAAVEEKPSGVVEETLESDAPKIKSRGGPRKILLQRQ